MQCQQKFKTVKEEEMIVGWTQAGRERSFAVSIPHLKSEIWGTRFCGGSGVGHPPMRLRMNGARPGELHAVNFVSAALRRAPPIPPNNPSAEDVGVAWIFFRAPTV